MYMYCLIECNYTQVGDKVEYRPVGGASDNVSHSTGEIINIDNNSDETRYVIRNDNTGKETTYKVGQFYSLHL